MADRNAPASFTFEQWRVEFNELATDVGDIANLPATIDGNAVTDVIEAIDEINTAIGTTGFTVAADSGTPQAVVISDTLTIQGTSNEIETQVGATDTVTIGLPNNVTITNDLNVGANLDVATQATLASANIEDLTSGRVVLAGTSGEIEDSGNLTFDGSTLTVTGDVDVTGDMTIGGNITIGDADTDSLTITADLTSHVVPNASNTYDLGEDGKAWRNLYLNNGIVFEGSTDDGFETTLVVEDPSSDITLTLPAISDRLSTEGFSIAVAVALG